MNTIPYHDVLVVGDSRLRHLESHLNSTSLNIQFTVKSTPGARMANITLSTLAALSYSDVYQLVIVSGGINDMSKLVYLPTKHALPRYGNSVELVENSLNAFRVSMDKIRATFDTPAILATVPGMNFATYSPEYADILTPIQGSFNRSVVEINSRIRGINRLANLDTVNLAYPVYRCKGGGGRYTTQFSYFYDGLHPTEQLLDRWATMIIRFCTDFFSLPLDSTSQGYVDF